MNEEEIDDRLTLNVGFTGNHSSLQFRGKTIGGIERIHVDGITVREGQAETPNIRLTLDIHPGALKIQ